MATLERICPNCGATNSADRTRCVGCDTNLIALPARRQTNLPMPLDNARAAGLVLGISAVVARAAIGLLTREVLPRLIRRPAQKRTALARERMEPDDQHDYVIRGWRTWSVRRGEEHSSGSEQFEWRVKRRT